MHDVDLLIRNDNAARDRSQPFLDDPVGSVQRLADALAKFWSVALEADWPRVQSLLEADILYRSRRPDRGRPRPPVLGPPRRGQVGRDVLTIQVHVRGPGPRPRRPRPRARAVRLLPHKTSAMTEEPWQPTRDLPRRAASRSSGRRRETAPEALGKVVGRSRAALLVDLNAAADHHRPRAAPRHDARRGLAAPHRAEGLRLRHRPAERPRGALLPLGAGRPARHGGLTLSRRSGRSWHCGLGSACEPRRSNHRALRAGAPRSRRRRSADRASLYGGPGPASGTGAALREAGAPAPQLETQGPGAPRPILISGASAYRTASSSTRTTSTTIHGAATRAIRARPQPGDDAFSRANGTYTYPSDPAYAQNAADLVELRVKPLAARRRSGLTLNTAQGRRRGRATIAIGDGRAADWPHGANVPPRPSWFLTVHGDDGELL